jgi:hypothetical protein
MIEINSQDAKMLLHLVIKSKDFEMQDVERMNLGTTNDFLQVALLNIEKPKMFQSHRHIYREVKFEEIKAQEAWYIVSGKVLVKYYDLNNELIQSEVLSAGDLSITYSGGHGYEILEIGTKVIEFKTGPYEGPELDKVFIP